MFNYQDKEEHGVLPGQGEQALQQIHQLAELRQHGLDVAVLGPEVQPAPGHQGES